MADRLLLETSATDGVLLEDGTGVLLLEQSAATDPPEAVSVQLIGVTIFGLGQRNSLT